MSNAPNQEDIFEDEIVTWLQYPLEDTLDKSYCSDAPKQWTSSTPPPPTSAIASSRVGYGKPSVHDLSLFMGRNTSPETAAYSHDQSLLNMRSPRYSMESLPFRSSTADGALALGAHRAAGLSSQVGQEAFNRVRTSIQPQASNLHGFDHSSSSVASESKGQPHELKKQGIYGNEEHDKSVRVKELILTPHMAPSRENMGKCGHKSREPSHTHFKVSASIPNSGSCHISQEKFSIRSSKGPASSMQLTSASIPPCSAFSDGDCHKMAVFGKRRQSGTMYPASCSIDSPATSLDLSCRDVTFGGKRKFDESDELSEMSEDDRCDGLVELKRKSSSLKRNRIPEAHNLSERKRRNRINEKLRSLQDLIPNSTKTDKASVLDEAIDYMKTLQMQLQMLSMRNSRGMPPVMMIPMGLPQSHMHLSPFQGVGIGVPVGHAGMPLMGAPGLGAGMVDMGFPMAGMPPRSFPTALSAVVSEYGIPFESGKEVSFMESYGQVGYGPSESLRTTTQSQHKMSGKSEREPNAQPCPGHEQEKNRANSSVFQGNVQDS